MNREPNYKCYCEHTLKLLNFHEIFIYITCLTFITSLKHCCIDGIYLLSLHTGEKPDTKDFRSDPPGKIKLPGLHKPPVPPPPAKEKPIKLAPK